jgi:hypothetical protein
MNRSGLSLFFGIEQEGDPGVRQPEFRVRYRTGFRSRLRQEDRVVIDRELITRKIVHISGDLESALADLPVYLQAVLSFIG